MKRKARSITPGNEMKGKNYDPYVKGHHFGSKGIVGRIYNRQIERTQHTISNLELKYLTLLKWSKVPTRYPGTICFAPGRDFGNR